MSVGATTEGEDFDAAFRELFRPAFRVAYRILGNVADAEDAAAEALARACVRWRRVSVLSYRDAWVMRVAANVAVDMSRQRRTLPALSEVLASGQDGVVERVALAAALQALSRRQREVVALRYLGGLPEAEVATTLGISVNSVKTHSLRGLTALRSRLGPDFKEAGVGMD
jgi:RNA polymerase sigma-70 factor (ECF subfamily)